MAEKRPLRDSIVLVVEDDELVRICAVEMLEDAGFLVVEACDGDEAWAILLVRSDIGVVFTDVDMPGSMSGLTLAERVHASWPEIRLILASGRQKFDDSEVPDHGRFVSKPYSRSQVIEALNRAV